MHCISRNTNTEEHEIYSQRSYWLSKKRQEWYFSLVLCKQDGCSFSLSCHPPLICFSLQTEKWWNSCCFASFVRGKEQQSEVAAGKQDCNILRIPSVESGLTEDRGQGEKQGLQHTVKHLLPHHLSYGLQLNTQQLQQEKGQNSSS